MRFFIALGIGALAACGGPDQPGDGASGGADGSAILPDGSAGDAAIPRDGSTGDGASTPDGGDIATSDGATDATTSDGATDATTNDSATDAAMNDSATDVGVNAGPLYPAGRLFVSMAGSALGVWDKSSSITVDVAPTFTLSDSSVTSGTLGIVLAKKRLLVGTTQATGALVAFDGADALLGSASPAAKIPASQLVAYSSDWAPSQLTWDAKSDSLWAGNQTGIEHFAGASAISSSSSSKALFTHPWHQLPGVAYDPTSDQLFLGQISGAGLLSFGSASSASGTPSSTFSLSPSTAAWSMTIAGDRLYATTPSAIAVWKGISGVSATKAPDFTMGTGSGLDGFIPYITVSGDVLVACTQSGKVLVWTHASALSGDATPTQTIPTGGGNDYPTKAVLGPVSGRLYVMDGEGIAIYATPTTSPTLVAKIKSGIVKPADFAVLE